MGEQKYYVRKFLHKVIAEAHNVGSSSVFYCSFCAQITAGEDTLGSFNVFCFWFGGKMTEAARLRVISLYFAIGFCAQVATGADNMGFFKSILLLILCAGAAITLWN